MGISQHKPDPQTWSLGLLASSSSLRGEMWSTFDGPISALWLHYGDSFLDPYQPERSRLFCACCWKIYLYPQQGENRYQYRPTDQTKGRRFRFIRWEDKYFTSSFGCRRCCRSSIITLFRLESSARSLGFGGTVVTGLDRGSLLRWDSDDYSARQQAANDVLTNSKISDQ